jgi:hypothetical protein
MAAIPLPDAIPDDEDKVRRIIAGMGAQAQAIQPQAVSNRGIPVTPQTPGRAIPVNRATGAPEELNNAGKPIAPGVAGLWARADNIHSPFIRALGKIGAAGARAIDVAGSVAAPGIAAQIPGSTLNQKVAENRAEKQQTSDTENAQRTAQTAEEQEATREMPAKANLENAQADALNNKPDITAGKTPDELVLHDLMTGENGRPRVNPNTGQPYKYLEAYAATKQAAQDTKPDNAQTDKTVRIVNGVPHEILIDKKTGADIKDLGQTKLPGESSEQKRSAAESVQVEREARAAIHKAEQEYNGALSTVQMQRQLIKDAKGGNKEAVRIVPLEGALQITTSQGVHRINRTEVEQYGQAGSLYDRIVGRIGSGVSGKSIPNDVLADMDAMTQELAQNAHQRYQREYDYNKQVVEGYGGKDFDKRVPMMPAGNTESGASQGGGKQWNPQKGVYE